MPTSRLPDPPPTVLLLDGDPTARQIALSMLRHLGVEADAAPSALVAVERAGEKAYDVALVGVPLAGVDGAEAAAALRAAGVARVVALAALGDAPDGFDAVFQTPLSVALLSEALAPPAAPPAAQAVVARPHADASDDATDLLESVRAHVRTLLGEEDEAFVQELTVSFAESAREAAAQAAAAGDRADAAALAAAAHALKGSASNVGLDAMQAAWATVEDAARGGTVPAAPLAAALAETERTVGQLAQASVA